LEVNESDLTVKCLVRDVGDVWFGWRALTDIAAVTIEEDILAPPVPHRPVYEQPERFQIDPEAALPVEEYIEKRQELETDLQAGRRTLAEAMSTVSELQSKLEQEKWDRRTADLTFRDLRRKVGALSNENVKLNLKLQEQEALLGQQDKRRDDYHRGIGVLANENQQLKKELASLGVPLSQLKLASAVPSADQEKMARLAQRVAESASGLVDAGFGSSSASRSHSRSQSRGRDNSAGLP